MTASIEMPRTTHLYFSPHLDDVALSCAGLIAMQRARGEGVMVVTFFTGDTSEAPPDLARHFHGVWQLGDRPFVARCAEDVEAARVMGATHRHEGMLDAIYRIGADGGALYPAILDLFGTPRAEDERLVDALAARIAALITEVYPTQIYLPLGVGCHVDHIAVAKAGHRAARGVASRVLVYEEFPYATGAFPKVRPSTVEQALAVSEWAPLTPMIVSVDLDQRIAASRCYGNQIDDLFGGDGVMCALQKDYTDRIGGGRPAERYWIPEHEA